MTFVRFVNTLHEEVNISLDKNISLSVAEDYGVSAYTTVQRGEYLAVPCRTKDKDFSLNLGLLEFGAAYLFIITNVSSSWPPPLSLPHVQIDISFLVDVKWYSLWF
nr:solute carrier family 15 member 2-like [Manis javanica]